MSFGCWVLGAGSWVLGLGFWILGFELLVVGVGFGFGVWFWIGVCGFCVFCDLSLDSWVLSFGFRV